MRTPHRLVRTASFVAAALLAACQQQSAEAPRISMPTAAEHAARYFPIGTAPHTTTNCGDCHTSATTSFLQFDCIGCHTQASVAGGVATLTANPVHAARTCLPSDKGTTVTCFPPGVGTLSAVDEVAWSAKCKMCHPTGTAGTLDPDVHSTAYFPINAGTKHAVVTAGGLRQCTDCHAVELSPGVPDYSKVDCVTCHNSTTVMTLDGTQTLQAYWQAGATHGTDPGLTYPGSLTTLDQKVTGSMTVCLFCHDHGSLNTLPPSAHTYFPINTGDVHALGGPNVATCSDCHQDTSNRANVTCAGCHGHEKVNMDPQHAHSSAYTFVSSACLGCHPNGTAGAATGDLWFPIGSGTTHAWSSKAQTAAMACDDCHGATRTDTTQLKCSACHSSGATATVLTTVHGTTASDYAAFQSPHPAGTPQCILCHDMAVVQTQAAHSWFTITPTSGSRGTANRHSSGTIGCAGCHPATLQTTTPASTTPWAGDFSQIDCITCHRPSMSNLSSANNTHQGCKSPCSSRCNIGGLCLFDVYDNPSATQAQILQVSPACNSCHPNGGGT